MTGASKQFETNALYYRPPLYHSTPRPLGASNRHNIPHSLADLPPDERLVSTENTKAK